jgi:hypothetical protein
MIRREDRISARQRDFCISIRLRNWPSCETSIVGRQRNVISISLRPRCIDSSHDAVQVLACSAIFEACKSRENNAFP